MSIKLRGKTIIVVIGVFTVLIILLYIFSQLLLLKRFETLEERDVSRNLHTAMNSLGRLVDGIDILTGDWAAWDDTYAFMENRNLAYLESNMADETFAGAMLNFIVYYDVSGKLIYGKAFDYHDEEVVDLPDFFLNESFSKEKILYHRDTKSGHKGIYMFEDSPILISSHPITTSNKEGPKRGTLIMGRFLDAAEVDSLSKELLLPIKVLPYGSKVLEIYGVEATHFEMNGIAIHPLTESSILGLGQIRDVYGKPALVIRTELERETYSMGKTGIYYFMLYLLISGIILGWVLIVLIDRAILSRIKQLGKSLSEVGRSGNLSLEIPTKGSDEISVLAGEVKGMLRSLEEFGINRKETEETLRQQKEELDNILESLAHPLYSIDINTYDIVFANSAAKGSGAFVGGKCHAHTHKRDTPCQEKEHPCPIKIVKKTRRPTLVEHVHYNLKGEKRFFAVHGYPVFDGMGNLIQMIESNLDITDQKRAEEERERLLHVIDQVNESIVITDTNGTIQHVNPTFEEVTGYTYDEAIGQNPRILKSGEHNDAFYKEMWETLTRGETWHGQIVNKKKDKTLYTEEVTISPVCDKSGKLVNYVSFKRDVTEDIKIKEQQHQDQKVESIGRLAGGVAHDLNNLLTPIIGYSEMLSNDFGADKARKNSVGQILHAGIKARDLVRQLLAFSRKQTLVYKPVDMNKAVTDFETLLRRTIREDITIKVIQSPDMRMVMADIGQIEQVIMNLTVNSQDAMSEGGCLIIETALVELDKSYTDKHSDVEPGTYVMLAVSDTGIGMDEATRKQIFEPFYSTKGSQGTGLGLATVYGIIKQHGGDFLVYSEPGKGTTIKVYLPVSEETSIEEESETTNDTDLKGSETILLAEDNEQVRDFAHTVLIKQGYTVLVAENGPEALKVLASHDAPVHLLLTDVIMPEMGGKELYTRITEMQPAIKVIYMSGYTDNIIAHHGVLDKGIAFIQKPFTIQFLTAKVREVLEND